MHVAVEFLYTLLIVLYSYVEAFIKLFIPVQPKSVKDWVVLVTGGAAGIGREVALRLAEKGARIVLLDVDTRSNEQTAQDIRGIGAQAFPYTCDVSNRDDVAKTAAAVKREVGEVDMLINNAGIAIVKYLTDLTEEEIRKTVNINLIAHFWTLQEFLPAMMKRQRGHVVTISSIAGCTGSKLTTDYSATKFAVRGLTESVELEVASMGVTGIKFTTVYPLFTDTNLVRSVSDRITVHDRFGGLMSPAYVGEAIVDGVLKNQREVFIPRSGGFTDHLKILLPTRGAASLRAFLDINFEAKN